MASAWVRAAHICRCSAAKLAITLGMIICTIFVFIVKVFDVAFDLYLAFIAKGLLRHATVVRTKLVLVLDASFDRLEVGVVSVEE